MRLIDADALKQTFCAECNHSIKCDDCDIDYHFTHAPTVDPIKHGHWIEHDVGLICSECGHYTESMYDEPFNNKFGKGWALKRPYYCGYCGAKMDIDDAPTVDAVEVVRCKDCVYYGEHTNYIKGKFCIKHSHLNDDFVFHCDGDDYCSWGERKDEVTDGAFDN